MGQTGVPTPKETIDKIVRLRDEQGLDWKTIGERFGMRPDSCRQAYVRRKSNLDLEDSEATDDLE